MKRQEKGKRDREKEEGLQYLGGWLNPDKHGLRSHSHHKAPERARAENSSANCTYPREERS